MTRRSVLPVLELMVTTRRRERRVGRITSAPDLRPHAVSGLWIINIEMKRKNEKIITTTNKKDLP